MDADLKKILRAVSLELRHTLEGTYDERGGFHPGDLEDRLNALGVWRDRPAKPLSELGYLPNEDKEARRVVDAYLAFRAEAGVGQGEAVAEFVRESAYTWANRLLALRCMEARGIIDEVILQKEVYGWRSMVHNRLGRQDPALLATPDEGLFAVLSREFELRARELPGLFNPRAPAIALRPSLAALKKCIGLLSGTEKVGSNGGATDTVFAAPDALGWTYQYWNAEEKDRVFEKVRTERGAKIEGADIIPATQLYTEPYMVKFLVQNSLGALWVGMHPDSNLTDGWEYYVRDADRAPVEQKRVQAITFLDPACGSGHFHLEAFDLLYAMYEEEGELSEPESICAAILNHNLYGVDIDERAVQIAQAALWMRAKEVAWDLAPEALTDFHHHFVATNIRLPQGKDHLEAFLRKHPEDLPLRPALETVFEGLENAHELGSLLQLEEPVEKELRFLRGKQEETQQDGIQSVLFAEMEKPRQGKLPVGIESYAAWKEKILSQLRGDFETQAEAADLTQAFFGQAAGKGLTLFDILARRYDVIAANPPYMTIYTMSVDLRGHLKLLYPRTYYDLFSAFMERAAQMMRTGGQIAFVTQSSFLFIRNYSELRDLLLENAVPTVVAHLGSKAFADISGEKVNVLLYIGHRTESQRASRFLDARRISDKAAALRNHRYRQYDIHAETFKNIPNSPFIYNMPEGLKALIETNPRFVQHAQAFLGLKTAKNDRFVRFFWEVLPTTSNSRWKPLVPATNSYPYYCDTYGRVTFRQGDIEYYRNHKSAQIYNETLWFRPGLTFGAAAGRGFDVKVLSGNAMVLNSSNLIIPHNPNDIVFLAGVLNSSLYRVLMNLFNPTINNTPGDVHRLPWPEMSPAAQERVEKATKVIIGILEGERAIDPTSEVFEWPRLSSGLKQGLLDLLDQRLQRQREFIEQKAKIEDVVFDNLCGDRETIDFVLDWFGKAPCHVVRNGAAASQEITVRPIDADCLLEAICIDLDVNPEKLTITSIPETLRQDELARMAQAWVTRICLQLLGYHWPKQANQKGLFQAWSDNDGIIPVTRGGHGEDALYDRFKKQLVVEFPNASQNDVERELAELLGLSLADWLAAPFNEHHISQYEKRPIAWQLQTATRGRGRDNAAFSCLINYHRLDADLLPKIRSQYIRDLRRGYETEQRTLRQLSSRTADQDARLLQLDAWLDELTAFAEKLEQVSASGFGDTPALQAQLRQYAIDNAMQSLKAAWLRRLADVVAGGPLHDWQFQAEKTGIHSELGDWIAAAIDTLHHHCASVGAKSPQAGKLKTDPDARALAAVIGTQAAQMVKQAISLACDVWFDDLDSHVLRPALDEINELKAQVSEQEERLNDLGAHETRARYDAEQAIKSLKARIKKMAKARNGQRKKAKELRQHIEGWTCPEAASWTEWLGKQPLFDQFASSDGQKTPPRTIADFVAQESRYDPDINDGVRVNIAPLQKAGLLAADVLSAKDVDKAIADRADWRADERRWCREGKLPRPGWWAIGDQGALR